MAEKKAPAKSRVPKKVKVKFLKSPTGVFKLGYAAGDVATFEATQAKELIDTGYAEKSK